MHCFCGADDAWQGPTLCSPVHASHHYLINANANHWNEKCSCQKNLGKAGILLFTYIMQSFTQKQWRWSRVSCWRVRLHSKFSLESVLEPDVKNLDPIFLRKRLHFLWPALFWEHFLSIYIKKLNYHLLSLTDFVHHEEANSKFWHCLAKRQAWRQSGTEGAVASYLGLLQCNGSCKRGAGLPSGKQFVRSILSVCEVPGWLLRFTCKIMLGH